MQGLNALKGSYMGDCMGESPRGYKGDTRSLDYRSHETQKVAQKSLP